MRQQLRRVLEAATLPTVTLQVLPLTIGEAAGMRGAFTIYGFPEPTDPEVVHLEHPTGDLGLERPEQIRQYASVFDRLRASALSPDHSAAFIAKLSKTLHSGAAPGLLRGASQCLSPCRQRSAAARSGGTPR
jgi:Domain of unknown function (DUF5753)